MKFVIENQEQKPEEPPVVFGTYLDSDGDLNLTANGHDILWIDSLSGDLLLYQGVSVSCGLPLDEKKRIVIGNRK